MGFGGILREHLPTEPCQQVGGISCGGATASQPRSYGTPPGFPRPPMPVARVELGGFHSQLWRALPQRGTDQHRLCGIDREPSGEHTFVPEAAAVEAATDLPWLREVPALQTLRRVWAEQYTDPSGPLRWRTIQDRAPSAVRIASPYDPDARYNTKLGIAWIGYKVHLTETCGDGQPHLITGVMTTPATTPDCVMGPPIQDDLATRDLVPGVHLFDGGYVDAELLVTAQTTYQIDVVGPSFGSYSHQRQAGQRYDLQAFVMDWEANQALCPQGQTSVNMPGGRGSKAHTRRPSDAVACAGPGISDWPRLIYSICSPPWPSTWSGWASGGWARPLLRRAALPLLPCRGLLPELAAPMNSPQVSHSGRVRGWA
jgi:hypothetical protein